MSDNSSKLDIAPLTVIVSEALDPRVRRKLEAEQQADVKTYEEMTRQMEMQDDLAKIKDEVASKGDESDPFDKPEPVENTVPQQQPATPAPAENPTPAAPAETPAAPAPAEGTPAPATPAVPAAEPAPAEGEEDLSSAFESYGNPISKDLLRLKVLKEYIKMESSDVDSTGELEHIKTFVYIDLATNSMKGDTLESVQTIRDPENTIVVINEKSSPDADTTLKARSIAEQLSNRGVTVFYDPEEAINYLNELYDVVSGRKKGTE